MAASSSSRASAPGRRCEPLSCSSRRVPAHDVFLSHSGFQKPFVEALYQRLRTRYSTFFDITQHSLPLGEHFPSHIFHAARTCRLAVVVLSEEFVQSKWPMLELCEFVAATPPPKILPLFFKLTVDDLKQKENLDKWRSAWQKFAEEDPSRINVCKWESALRKVSSHNGIPLKQCEDESAYIERVFSGICENVRPSMRYDFSGIQGIHRLSEVVLTEFEAMDNDQSKVCVLGMYGLPGSGKSTICRYLYEYLFSEFLGKAIYLELPTDADDEELLVKSKELLKQLTNFNSKMDLSCVSNFREVYHLLKGTDIVSSKVFLVIDNITSQVSGNLVKALLRLGLTVGSKLLLVARSVNAMCPLLQEDGSHQSSHHYVYGSMSVPCLNKEEALGVLLQSGDGMGLEESSLPMADLTQRHKQIMEEVISMSGFSGEHGCMNYLPLVLKIMGEKLKEHELNVEKWNRTMKSFQIAIGLCKEEALKQMVLESFRMFPGKLQALFLDMALFILPLSYIDGESHELDEACSHLSLIHGCNSEEIEFEMQKLQQHGFLTIWKSGSLAPTISVHDFYLEFAASIEEACKYYWSSGLRWSKVQRNQAIEAVGSTRLELRTVVLELDEGCEDFEVSSDLSRVRALVLRNSKSLKTLRGFANLINLVSLEIWNCPSFQWIEPPANGYKLPYLQRFKWVDRDNGERQLEQHEQKFVSLMKATWRLFWENLGQIGSKRSVMAVDGRLLLQMKGLQVLRLENTGIKQSVDISGCCLPQLRMLEVRERHMKCLRVCNLPNLERFVFFGDAKPPEVLDIAGSLRDLNLPVFGEEVCDSMGFKLEKGILAGCPKVQEVYMQRVALADEANSITLASSHLTKLRVNGLWNGSRLPDFSACSESLEELSLFQCRELRSLNFGCIFRNLQRLSLQACHNLTEVSGFCGLPMLLILQLYDCQNLKVVGRLDDLVSLEMIRIVGCPNIERCLLPDLESLIELRLIFYIQYGDANGTWGVRKLVKLRSLWVDFGSWQGTTLVDLLGMRAPCCFSLMWLKLSRLENLRSLNGIQFLGSLKFLWLGSLQNLSCLRGIEGLGELQWLLVEDCASVEEMPSLSTLMKLQCLYLWDCKNLRSVEGFSELGQLKSIELRGCEMARFPSDLSNWKSCVRELRIEGASEEVVVAWPEHQEEPELLSRSRIRSRSVMPTLCFMR